MTAGNRKHGGCQGFEGNAERHHAVSRVPSVHAGDTASDSEGQPWKGCPSISPGAQSNYCGLRRVVAGSRLVHRSLLRGLQNAIFQHDLRTGGSRCEAGTCV